MRWDRNVQAEMSDTQFRRAETIIALVEKVDKEDSMPVGQRLGCPTK